MKTFIYKVGIIKDESGETKLPMTGTVEVEIPTYKERLNLIQELGFNSGESEDKNLDRAKNMIKEVEKRIKSISIKLDNGEEVNSLEDLGYYKEGSLVINHIGKMIISGFEVGKS
jgi:hypothetical protein